MLRKIAEVKDFRVRQQRIIVSFDGCKHLRSVNARANDPIPAMGDPYECLACTGEPEPLDQEKRVFWMRVYEAAIRAGNGPTNAVNYADEAVKELEQR